MKYNGMTVNERLHVSGLLKEYDNAIKQKNVGRVVEILKSVELNDISIQLILKRENL